MASPRFSVIYFSGERQTRKKSGGFWAMPGNRHHLPGRAGRNIAGVFDLAAGMPSAGETVVEELMPRQHDGVLGVGLRLGPDARTAGLPAEGKGQFYLVCAGSIIAGEKILPERSVVRLEPEDPGMSVLAGGDGALVLAAAAALALLATDTVEVFNRTAPPSPPASNTTVLLTPGWAGTQSPLGVQRATAAPLLGADMAALPPVQTLCISRNPHPWQPLPSAWMALAK